MPGLWAPRTPASGWTSPRGVEATGESVQEAARILRYQALQRVAEERGATRIAVGHTLTDQAETVLLNLLRGAGPRGLAGIAPVMGLVVRPLLAVSRAETEAVLRAPPVGVRRRSFQ